MIKKICIIGAGFAGLTSARVFKALKYDVTLYEKEADVGGVWSASRRYPGVTTQNPRTTYELSDFPMPSSYPEWPSGEQVQHYMQSYVDHYDFSEQIRLNSEVLRASFDSKSKTWDVHVRVTKADGSSKETKESFDFLIVGNGIFSVPSIPTYKGVESFVENGGRICHTSEFTRKLDARDKNILVIGYGKSSCDVANAIYGISKSTTVVARNLIWKIPKFIGNTVNYKHLFMTRLSEALFRYIHLKGVDKFLHTIGNPIRKSMLNSVEFVVEKQLGLKRLGLHPNAPLESIARSTVSLVSDDFYQNIENGKIAIKKQTIIDELKGREAYLSNGEILPVDLIVCGTGWQQVCPFLDKDVMDKVTDHEGNFRLFRSMIPVDVPRLAFNGYNSSFFSQLNCEIGALWLADYLNGGFQLPSSKEQNKSVDRRLAWMKERTDGKHSKGTNIIPFSIHHIDELLGDMKMNIGRFARFKQWLRAVQPSVYSYILPALQKKYGKS